MIAESRELIANYDKYFKRLYRWRYSILIVDNQFFDCYSFFMQAHKDPDRLHYSYDLLGIPHDKQLFLQVLGDFKKHSKMSIEYRTSAPGRLIANEPLITEDLVHGHGGHQ